MNVIKSLLLAVCVSVIFPSLAQAQDNRALAREHFERGSKFFDLQRYHEAVKEYETAYELHASPELLYNIAQAARNAGDYQKAIGAYRMFLVRSQKVSQAERDVLTARIEELKKLAEEQKRTQEKPPTGTKAPPEGMERAGGTSGGNNGVGGGNNGVGAGSNGVGAGNNGAGGNGVTGNGNGVAGNGTVGGNGAPATGTINTPPRVDRAQARRDLASGRDLKIAGGVTAGVGVLALGVLAPVFATIAKSADDTLNHPRQGTVYSGGLENKVTSFQGAEMAMIAVGAAAVVTGVTLIVVGQRRSARAHMELAPAIGKNAASLALTGSF
jgi:hypothetical protein